MAEKVDEIAALLERLKIENDLNINEFNSILLDMKTKLENMDFDNSQIGSLINDINDTVNSKISKDEEKFIDIETTLRHLQNLVENANDTEKYSKLQDEIEILSSNFKEAVESIVKFANQDADSKNILFEKVTSLETAVKNNEVIDVVKEKSEDLVNSFEHYTADSNLRHGNVISAIADLRHVIDDYSAKNTYLINTLENTVSGNTQQLANLEGTVSAQMGTVNSKLFTLSDDIHKTLDDGFEHLKYLSTNLSEYMNSNSIDMKTSMECLRANLSDYSEQLKTQVDNFTGAFDQKFADASNIQTRNTQSIIDEITAACAKIDEKAIEYENSLNEKTSKIYEFLTAYKDAVSVLQDDNKDYFDKKLVEFETGINDICSEYENLLNSIRTSLDEYSSQVSETADSVVLGVVNHNQESINTLKGELLASSNKNLDSIIGKIDETSTSINNFKEDVADNLSQYLSAIKDLFVDYSNRMDESMQDEEIINKLYKVEELINNSNAERNSNFDIVRTSLEETKSSIANLNSTVENKQNEYINKLNELQMMVSDNSSKDEIIARLNELIFNSDTERNANFDIVRTSLEESKSAVSNLAELTQNFKDDNFNELSELKMLIASSSEKDEIISRLENLINEKSLSKDEQLKELKRIVEEYNIRIDDIANHNKYQNDEILIRFDELKGLISQSSESRTNFERIENLINNTSEDKNEKLESLRNILAEYKNSVEKLTEDLQIQNGNTTSDLYEIKSYSKDILPKLEALQNIESLIQNKASDYKENLRAEVGAVQESIREIIKTINEISGTDSPELTGKLASFEMQLGEASHNYEQGLDALKTSINDYISGIEKINTETHSKLDLFTGDIENIKNNFEDISSKMSTLIGDSGLIEILANIRQQFNPILQALHNEKEDLHNSLNDGIESVSSNLYLIGQNLEEVRVKQSENAEYLRSNFEEKMLGLQADIEHTVSNIKETVSSQANDFAEQFNSLKENVNGFLGLNYGQLISEIKEQVEISYVNLTNQLNSSLENFNSFEKIDSSYQNAVEKFNSLEQFIHETTESNIGEINQSLLNLSTMLQNNFTITESIQNSLETGILKLQSDIQENKVAIKSSLVDLLENIKSFINEKKTGDMDDLRSAILPLLDNEEMLDVIKSLNKNLAERLEECSKENTLAFQDILDIINSVSNTVNYTIEVINEKFENTAASNQEINQKLDAVNSKLDIIALDDNSEITETISGIDESISDIKEIIRNVNNLITEINDNTTSGNSVIPAIQMGIDQLKEAVSHAKEEIKSNLVYENAFNEINLKLDTINASSEENIERELTGIKNILSSVDNRVENTLTLLDLVKVLDNKLDIIALNDNSELEEDIQTIKNDIEIIRESLETTNKSEELLKVINNKLDILAQDSDIDFDFETDIEAYIKPNLLSIESKLDSLAQADNIRNIDEKLNSIQSNIDLIHSVNNKLDLLAQADNSEILDSVETIHNDTKNIDEKLNNIQSNTDLIHSVNNKLDILAQADDSEILDSVENIHNTTQNIDEKLNNIQSNTDLIHSVNNKLDILAQADNSEILDSVENIHNTTQNIDEKLNNIQSNTDLIHSVNNKLDILAQADNSEIIDSVETIHNDTKNIDNKLEIIKANTESNPKLEELISTLHNKVDVLAMSDDNDIQEGITEIRDLIEEHIATVNSANVQEALQKLLNQISAIDLSKQAGDIKDAVISAVISVSNEISFVEETEEIKDFVNEKTNELHRTMMDVKRQLSTLTCSGDDMDIYSYTLQDVESDIAKLRLILKDMSGDSSSNEICVISNNISKISRTLEHLQEAFTQAELNKFKDENFNEQILSISSRLNQLLLSRKEVDNMVLAYLKQAAGRLEQIDNSDVTKGIEEVLVAMDKKLEYSNNLNTILKNVMMYLGEWMDGTTETISSIYDKSSKINSLTDAINDLRKSAPDRRELVDFIEARFTEQESKIDRLERQLEKVSNALAIQNQSAVLDRMDLIDNKLEKLTKNIEKLASYVE